MADGMSPAESAEDMSVHESFMRQALELAGQAAQAGEVPVGAVIVKDGIVIGTGRNRTEETRNPFMHAEMNAMQEALDRVGGWRLTGCDMYVTLEPCSMCAGAAVHARLDSIIIGTADPKAGACGSVLDITSEKRLNHQPAIVTGVLRQECSQILKDFFREIRRKKK